MAVSSQPHGRALEDMSKGKRLSMVYVGFWKERQKAKISRRSRDAARHLYRAKLQAAEERRRRPSSDYPWFHRVSTVLAKRKAEQPPEETRAKRRKGEDAKRARLDNNYGRLIIFEVELMIRPTTTLSRMIRNGQCHRILMRTFPAFLHGRIEAMVLIGSGRASVSVQ